MGSKKVIVRVFGGIGNQLFCYAAARRLAYVNDAELVIDHVSGFTYDKKYRRIYQLDHFHIPARKATPAERFEPFSRFRRFIIKRINRFLPFEKRKYICEETFDFDPRLLNLQVNGTVYLEGYWQSEKYFKDIEPIIREDLRIKPPLDNLNQEMAKKIRECLAVAIHIRFFDKPGEKSENNLPSSYYKEAIDYMESRFQNPHYFIFSDYPESARELIPLPDSQITLITHNKGEENAYADLWLMSQCKHFIIANSTFSWWGAWLSDNKEKIVIAPKMNSNAGAWRDKGFFPEEWVLLTNL
jgi:hypothetical protein